MRERSRGFIRITNFFDRRPKLRSLLWSQRSAVPARWSKDELPDHHLLLFSNWLHFLVKSREVLPVSDQAPHSPSERKPTNFPAGP